MKQDSVDVVVIGGGAAGMLASAVAAERGRRVLLLEPNDHTGRKLRITGKGRCNLTNDCDIAEFLANVPRNGRFLYSALTRLPPRETIELFRRLGLPTVTERGNRVFPESGKAADVVETLQRYMDSTGVEAVKSRALGIDVSDGRVRAVNTPQGVINCAAAIVCTGGLSYPKTGSTGDGYRMARALGHSVTALNASLIPLESPDPYCAQIQGFSLKNVRLSVYGAGPKPIYSELGEMLFTHFGVSGPLVLSASAHMRDFGNVTYRLSIDLKPGLDEKKLDNRLLRDFESSANKDFKSVLSGLCGRAMIPVIAELSGIPGELKAHSITREQRKNLVALFKAFPVNISGPRPIDEAVVTSGGVDVREVEPATMESKLVKGLYFAGEVLDVDAYTGGFNLQIAWSTAYAAGNAV